MIVLTIVTPVGVSASSPISFDVTSSVPSPLISVILSRQGQAPTVKAAAIQMSGGTGTVTFEAGLLPPGTYDVVAVGSDGVDSGFIVGVDLVLSLSPDPVETQYWELVRATFQANAPILDVLRDVGPVDGAAHPDILIDSLGNLDRLAQSPGIIIEPMPGESEHITWNSRSYLLKANVYAVARADYEGMRNDGDRRNIEELARRALNALMANQNLGGFLKKPIEFSTIETVAFRLPNVRNATILTSFFTIEALLVRRGAV